MRALLRWSVRIVGVVLLLFVMAAIAVIVVLNTESGTRWAIAQANQRIEGQIEADEFDGTLWRGLNFSTFRYRDAGQEILANNAAVKLDWAAVFSARIVVKSLQADSIEFTNRRPPAASPTPLEVSLQPLPVYLSVRDGRIGRFSWVDAERTVDIHDIELRRLSLGGLTLRADALSGRVEEFSLSATDLDTKLGNEVPVNVALAWSFRNGEWAGTGSAHGSLAKLVVQQDVSGEYSALVSADIYLLDRIEADVDALINWQQWTFGDYAISDGEVRLRGTPDDYATEFGASVNAPGIGIAAVKGTATGNTEGLRDVAASVNHADAELTAQGVLRWSPAFSADARVSGSLRGSPVNIDGDVTLGKEEFRCNRCVAQIGDNRLAIDGVIGNLRAQPGVVVNFSVDAPALEQALPDYSGQLSGEGTIAGTLETPRVSSRFTARNINYQQTPIGSGAVTARGDMTSLDVTADWNVLDINVLASGTLSTKDDALQARINSAKIDEANTGSWQLRDVLVMQIDGSDVRSNAHQWLGQHGELQIRELRTTGNAIAVDAMLRNAPMAGANRFLPANYALSGSANADIQLQRDDGLWSGAVAWRQSDTALRIVELNDETTDIVIPRGEVDVTLAGNTADIVATIEVDPGVRGHLNMRMDRLDMDANIDAHLRIDGDDWSWMSALVPAIDNFDGAIKADVRGTGPLNAPEFTGTATWTDGSLAIPSLNVPVTDIELSLIGKDDGAATVRGSATAGSGSLTLAGDMQNLMRSDRSIQLQLRGADAELVNWPEYRLWASPDLQLAWNRNGWIVGGDVTVPRADIRIVDLPEEAIAISPDVEVVGRQVEEDFSTRYSGQARLVLGDAVRIEAFGLNTGLTGELQFRQRPDLPPSAEGRVRLTDGFFEAYGQKLTIEEGTLTFTGPLDNPLVDVRAVRTIEAFDGPVKAGIHLRGRGQSISSTVYSDPAMAEADALSYLLIGRPLNEATQSEGGELSGAAVALGIRQATRITQQIGQSLGLDQLTLAGDGGDTTALVAGKQLNKRLHARYAYGVFSRLGTLLLRYRLSKRLTLEAATGETQSIDILYQVEKP